MRSGPNQMVDVSTQTDIFLCTIEELDALASVRSNPQPAAAAATTTLPKTTKAAPYNRGRAQYGWGPPASRPCSTGSRGQMGPAPMRAGPPRDNAPATTTTTYTPSRPTPPVGHSRPPITHCRPPPMNHSRPSPITHCRPPPPTTYSRPAHPTTHSRPHRPTNTNTTTRTMTKAGPPRLTAGTAHYAPWKPSSRRVIEKFDKAELPVDNEEFKHDVERLGLRVGLHRSRHAC